MPTDEAFNVHERGLSVASGGTAGLAAGLSYLISNVELRAQLGARGCTFVTQNYAKERLLADMSALYAELLQSEQASVCSTGRSPSPFGRSKE